MNLGYTAWGLAFKLFGRPGPPRKPEGGLLAGGCAGLWSIGINVIDADYFDLRDCEVSIAVERRAFAVMNPNRNPFRSWATFYFKALIGLTG